MSREAVERQRNKNHHQRVEANRHKWKQISKCSDRLAADDRGQRRYPRPADADSAATTSQRSGLFIITHDNDQPLLDASGRPRQYSSVARATPHLRSIDKVVRDRS